MRGIRQILVMTLAVIKKLLRNVLMHHELTSQPVGEPHLGKVLCYFRPCTVHII